MKTLRGGGETGNQSFLQFGLKIFFEGGRKSPPALIAVRSLNKVGHTVDEEKDKLQRFETCVVPFTALRNSKRAGLH